MSDMIMLSLGLVSDFDAKLDELINFAVDAVWKVNDTNGILPEDFHQADPEELDWQEVYDYIKNLVMTGNWEKLRRILKDTEIELDAQDSDDEDEEVDEDEEESEEETDEADSNET